MSSIPEILSYFVSGFIFIRIFFFLTSKDNKNSTYGLIWCVVTSYIIKSVVDVLDFLILPDLYMLSWTATIVYIVTGVISAVLLSFVYRHNIFKMFISKFTNRSVNSDIWKDIVDYELGTTMKIFLKNDLVEYIGTLIAHEEKGNESWFVFKDYIATYKDTSKFRSESVDCPTVVAINIANVDRMELFYNNNTTVFD